jgi:imidazoleglycerol-phosphate dehydratase
MIWRGVERFGSAYVPLDEALSRAVIDLSGRGYFAWSVPPGLESSWVTQYFPLTLVADFFQALADRARLTLHLDVLEGRNPHHVAESAFKAVGVALSRAVALRIRGAEVVPSTKGSLDA